MEARLLVLIAFLGGSCVTLHPELIVSYFKYKHVDYGSVYGCFNKKEHVTLAKSLMVFNLSISLFDISNPGFDINNTYVFRKNNERLGIVLDGDCSEVGSFLKQSDKCKLFTDVHYWLVFLSADAIEERFGRLALTISTDLKVAVSTKSEEFGRSWNLYDVYNPAGAHGGELKVTYYNTYIRSKPLVKWKRKEHLYWLRRNMTGVLFQAMVVLPHDFKGELLDYLLNDEHREINTFNRFHTVLVYHVQDFYNFSMNVSVTKSWGYKSKNGSFDGLVRALEDKVVDFGMSPLFVKDERWPVVDYGRRTWILRSAFIFRIPKRPASFEVFFRPLDGPVWYVTMVAIVVIVALLWIAMKTEYNVLRKVITSFESSLSYLLLFTMGALCQQGAETTPNSFCGRILVLYVFVFSVLFYQFYSASIVSILLMTPARVIKNLEDLVNSQLKIGVENTLYNKDYINKLQGDPIISALPTKVPKKGNLSFYVEPDDGLAAVANGGYAFHAEVATAYPIIVKTFGEDEICSLDEVQLFQIQQMHQPLQKHSPFREMINYVLQRIDEGGLMHRQLKHWLARKPECIRSKPPTESVSLEEFYPAISILVIGMAACVAFLALEYAFRTRLRKAEEERQRKRRLRLVRPRRY